MAPGMTPPAMLRSMRITTCRAVQITRASARRDWWALSERKGTWLTQMQAEPSPPTKEKASSAPGAAAEAEPEMRGGQQQARSQQEGLAAEAVAEHADGKGEKPGCQRRHAGDLADEILLVSEAQQVEVVEQREQRHAGVDRDAVEEEQPHGAVELPQAETAQGRGDGQGHRLPGGGARAHVSRAGGENRVQAAPLRRQGHAPGSGRVEQEALPGARYRVIPAGLCRGGRPFPGNKRRCRGPAVFAAAGSRPNSEGGRGRAGDRLAAPAFFRSAPVLTLSGSAPAGPVRRCRR